MKKNFPKTCIAFRILILVIWSLPVVMAQVGTPSYLNNTGTTANSFPLNTTTSNKVQWIYAPGAFTTLGGGSGTPVPAGMNITKVYIKFSATVNAVNTYTNLTISLGQNVGAINNYPQAPATTGVSFNTGLTTCFFQASGFQFTGITANAWYGITLQTPFAYDPTQALVVEVKTNNPTSGGNSVANVTTAGISQRLYAGYAATTGTANTGLTPLGFDVVSGAGCTDPITTPGTSTATPATPVCSGTTVGLNVSSGPTGSGLTYQWQSSTLIGGPYTNVSGVLGSPAFNINPTSTAYYRCEEICSGGTPNYSTPVLVTVNPLFPGGTYTINSAVATGGTNFQTFTAFKDALACGIAGPIIANVDAGSGPYNEQVEFPVIPGASAVNTITINGNGRTLTQTLTGTPTNYATLNLNGTDYLTVNNLNIEALGATYGFAVHLMNAADNNSFNNCTFSANTTGTGTTAACVSMSGSAASYSTSGVNGMNNTFSGCTTNGGYFGFVFYGSTQIGNTNNSILNCTIGNYYVYGSYNLQQANATISGNIFERPTRTTVSTCYGVLLSTCSNMLVEKNRIRKTWDAVPASTGTQYSIYLTGDASAGNENRIYNNLISDINFNGTIYGIYSTGSDYWKAYHNTFSLDQTAATGTTTTYGVYSSGTLAYEVRNNNIVIRRGGTGVKHCVYFTSPAAATSNNNNLYMNSPAGTNYIGYNGTSYATLATWQAGALKDTNSVSVDPVFAAPGAGDYSPTSGAMNDLGAPLSVADDINNAARSLTTPDMGAYEFNPPSSDAAISWVAPAPPVSSGLQTITVSIQNNTANTITDLNLTYTDGVTPQNQVFTGLSIGGLSSQNVSFTTPYNFTTNVSMRAWISSVNGSQDANQNNDTTAIQNICLVLSGGTYTINSALATGGTNFQTFTDFKNALLCGIGGPIIANVAAASGPYNEQVEFPQILGASAVNTITINGNGQTLTQTLTGTPTNYATLNLNGTDYLTINNLNIEALGATYGFALHMMNAADNNSFNNCTFSANTTGTGTTAACVSMSGSAASYSTSGVNGMNNTFSGCTTNGGYFGFVFYGSTQAGNTNNSVLNCTIGNYYVYGFYNLQQANATISGNIFERPTRTSVSTCYGVLLSTCSNMLVEKNRIRKTWDAVPASTGTQYSIYLSGDATPGNENRIFNNLISDINFNGTIYGIYSTGSDYWKAYHNTISLDQTSATGTTTTYGVYSSGTLAYDVRNNNISVTRGGTGVKHCVYYTSPAAATSNNNNLYMNSAAGTNYVGYNGTSYATLSAWQTGALKDTNSVSADPMYFDPVAGNYKPTSVVLDNAGTPVGVSDDINNAIRSVTTPDPGAYEFLVAPKDAGVLAFVTPVSGVCYTDSETVTVTVRNFGSDTLNFLTDVTTVTVLVSGAVTDTLTATLTGTLNPGTNMNVILSPALDMTNAGTYNMKAYTSLLTDGDATNDTLTTTRSALIVPGSVNAVVTTICVSGTSAVNLTGSSGGTVQWQESLTGTGGPWTNVGTGGNSYTPAAPITQTTYYRALLTCNASSDSTNVDSVIVSNPQVLTTSPATRNCAGPVTLGATVTAGANANWYQNPTGGTILGTGNSFTTPSLPATTTYYVEPAFGIGGTDSINVPLANGTTTGVYHHMFVVNSITGFTLEAIGIKCNMAIGALSAWDIYYRPDNYQLVPGANTSAAGWTLLSSVTNVPSKGATEYTDIALGLSLVVPPSSTYSIYVAPAAGTTHQYASTALGTVVVTNANASIVAGNRGSALFNCSTSGGMAVVNLKYSLGCAGPRVPVLATVVIPSLNVVASSPSVCLGNAVNLSVSSSNDPSYQYTWTSAPSGFTASGNGPHSDTPAVTTKYIVSALDTSGGAFAGCITSDSVSVATGILSAGTVHSTDSVLCLSGSPTLSVTGASGGSIQWQVSTTSAGGPFTNVGMDSIHYTPASPFTQTTYYRAEVRCDSVTALVSNTDSVVVFNPQVTNTFPATRCGPGNITVSATGSTGTTVNWYDASSGGSLLSSGDTLSTYIDSTTTLYASATTSGGGSGVAPMPAEGSVFSGNVRGFWFTSPVSFTITGLQSMASSAGLQSIAVVRFNPATPPPVYSTTTNAFTTLFLTQNNPATGVIPVNIPITAGDVIGILSQRGTGSSYATPTGPYVTTIAGQPVTLTRMGMQFPLGTTAPQDLWQEPAAAIGRTEITYSTGCESVRVPVVATYLTPPAMNTVTNLYSLCATSCDTLRVDSAGQANYQEFTWVPSAGLNSTTLSTVTACPSVTTTYTVYATDTVNGCLNLDTVRVNVTPQPTVNMSVTPALSCVGDSVQLESGALGGPASPLLLTTPLTVGNSSSAVGFDIQNTSAVPVKIHFLSFTSTAASGTSLTESVYYNTSPMNCVFPTNVTTAPGWSLIGTVGCTSAGTAPNLTQIPLDLNITIPPGATYAFCLGGASVAYSNGTAGCTVPIIASDSYISIREGFGGTLTSTIANRRFNGRVSYTYGGFVTNLWSPPTGLSDVNIHNPKASPAVTTTYTVLVTDTTTGCTNTGTVTANVSPTPQPYVFPNDTMLCTGSIINIVARDSGAYGGGWPVGTTFDYGFGPTTDSTFQVNGPGLYNVHVTLPVSMASCNAFSGFASIIFRDAPVLFVNADSVKCKGGSDGYVSAQSFLGSPPYRYIYYNSLGNVIHDTISPLPEDTLFNLPAGQYSVVVYDTASAVYPPPSCRSDSIPVVVPEPDELVASENHPAVNCFGNSTQVTITASGGTPPYTGLGTFTQFAGDQTYFIADAHGCTDSIVVTVTEPALLEVSLATTPNLCSGYGTSAITSTVSGGTSGFTYLWNNGSTTANRSSVTASTYTVTVTDANGCTASSSITTSPIAPVVITGTIVHVTCKGAKTGSITVSVSGGEPNYSYLWNNGSTTQNRNAIGYGTYIVTVTDANGCTKKASFVVNQPATQLIVNTSKTNVRCYGKNNGKATASPTGGVPPYTYSWNTLPVQTTASISGLYAGVYTCTVTDSIGCVKTATVTITEPPDMIVFQTQTNVTVNGGNDGTATVSVSGGTPGYAYQWNTVPVQTTTTATGLTAGTYKCTVIDSKSCSKKVTFIITEPPLRQTDMPVQPSAQEWDVRLYPNPTSGVVMIRFSHDEEANFNVSLTDFTGRQVYEKESRSVKGMNEVVYDFTGYAKGIYLVKVASRDRQRTLRMVIQ